MTDLTRRGFLAGAAALGTAASANPAQGSDAPVTVGPDDPRYASLTRGYNFRFAGRPDQIRLVRTSGQIEQAVAEATHAGKRIVARSGGHCLEDFVHSRDVQVVLDLSQFDEVRFDPRRDAFEVQAGATLGQVYDTLYRGWGVTVPGGVCPQVGVGGHFSGGGYGALSRLFGLVVDYLSAVEVVVADKSATPRTVVATADPADPNHDLWWAHTGGGGGNFGIVTRYWLRGRPSLPQPPASLLFSQVSWPWSALDERSHSRLIANFTRWHEHNSAPGSLSAALFATLWVNHVRTGNPALTVQVDGTLPNAQGLLDDFIAAVSDGVAVQPAGQSRSLPWAFARDYLSFADFGSAVGKRTKNKSSYLRAGYTSEQLATIYRHMTRTDYPGTSATILLASYGGAVNSVAPAATAVPQRDSIIKAQYSVSWTNPAEDTTHLQFVRTLYEDLFAKAGGVPVSDDVSDGAYINYPDIDLADPAHNKSAVAWHSLYYKDNYPRLQAVKRHWDPLNVFRHSLSVQPSV